MADSRERFEDLVVRYQDVVCAVAYSVLRDRARSEEVAQDAFLVAWSKLPSMASPPAMPGWLCGIARNLAVNAARRRREDRMDPSIDAAADGTPLESLLDREAAELARRALAELPDRDREVVVLYYRGDRSIGAVAIALGISEPAARQRLHRGRERLRTAVASVEAMLRSTRPGPAFTAACVAAMIGGATVSASAAGAATATAVRSAGAAFAVPAIGLGAAAIVGVWWAFGAGGAPAAVTAPASASVAKVTPSAADDLGPTATARPRVINPERAVPVRRITAEVRAEVARRIAAARRVRESGGGGGAAATGADAIAAPPPELLHTGLTRDEIKSAVKAVAPLLLECYTAEMDHLANPDGRIEVHMQFTGERDVGTLVDTTDIDGDANLLASTGLTECIGATLSSIELPPLVDGGEVAVTYPIVFRRDTDPPADR